MNSYLRSYPVLSFLNSDNMFNISPLGNITSNPNIFALKGPCFIKYFPAAWVAILPPIKHEPLAPKSQGISQLNYLRY